MPHIHTEPGQHDFTTSAIIFRYEDAVPKVLLHIHKKLGKLMQPGGHIELGENPWQAIAHEIEEETGYVLQDLEALQPEWAMKELSGAIAHPVPFCVNTHDIGGGDHKHTDLVFVFLAKDLPLKQPDIAGGESGDLRWLTQKEVTGLTDIDIPLNIKEIILGAFKVCLPNWWSIATNAL
ncbi:MAG TPA: NUDIX domain-containing protein [Candidatus Saccharimonadales bacterium]